MGFLQRLRAAYSLPDQLRLRACAVANYLARYLALAMRCGAGCQAQRGRALLFASGDGACEMRGATRVGLCAARTGVWWRGSSLASSHFVKLPSNMLIVEK